jgi:hypothetical protein
MSARTDRRVVDLIPGYVARCPISARSMRLRAAPAHCWFPDHDQIPQDSLVLCIGDRPIPLAAETLCASLQQHGAWGHWRLCDPDRPRRPLCCPFAPGNCTPGSGCLEGKSWLMP